MMVSALGEHPEWLNALLQTLGRGALPGGIARGDSALHLVDTLELRPDLLFATGTRGFWVAVEIQLKKDNDKLTLWPLIAAFLRRVRGEMGDIVVVTAQLHVAEWARTMPTAAGALGSRLGFAPVVLHLGEEEARLLLAAERPELAFFAAWAMQGRHGPVAQEVVEEALTRTHAVEDEALRRGLFRSILRVISDELAEILKAALMNLDAIPESPNEKMLREAFEQRFGASWEARGEAKMLLKVLAARGLTVDEATRAKILACTDVAQLERWGERAVSASSLDEVFS